MAGWILAIPLDLQHAVDHPTAAVHSQLLVDVVDVVLDRIVGNEELVLDLLVGFPLQDKPNDFALPIRNMENLAKTF